MKLLVKEIRSQAGDLHFRRWRLLYTPWFAIYIHGIYESDKDPHPHSHPWNFVSLILKGGYWEDVWFFNGKSITKRLGILQRPGSVVGHTRESYHKLVVGPHPTYTLVFTFGRHGDWGYLVGGKHVDHETYREMKHKEKNETQ